MVAVRAARGAPQAGGALGVAVGRRERREVVEHQGHARRVARSVELPHGLAERSPGHLPVARAEPREAEHVQRPGLHRPVAHPPVDGERGLELVGPGPGLPAEVVVVADAPQDVRLALLVAELAVEGERLVEHGQGDPARVGVTRASCPAPSRTRSRTSSCRERWRAPACRRRSATAPRPRRRAPRIAVDVALPPAHPAQRLHQPGPERRRVVRPRCRGHPLETAAGLGQVATLLPEPPQREGKPDRGLAVAIGGRTVDRGPQVVVFQLQPVQPGALVGPGELRRRAPGQVEEPGPEPAAHLGGLGATVQHLAGELADRLEHREPRLRRLEHSQQALVRQLADRVDEVVADQSRRSRRPPRPPRGRSRPGRPRAAPAAAAPARRGCRSSRRWRRAASAGARAGHASRRRASPADA